ncbi:type II toxin-antitoxin system Phd/YefM family antitoxin [Roseateles sp.]|uniref:type II toxin-antitoxin system Phd/YefM family antitoxin n=1 Tax=Roseateles sp. TaxID=1971397 RepID=UPI002DFE2EB5|nr:type II toxin-antitoxin system Phd/YefM family antitoxin [Roseateles sp.]
MEAILADIAVSMSEFKKNPAAVLREAKSRPVAVLNHNRAAFYMVEPRVFEAMMEELADQDLYRKAVSRLANKAKAVEVDLDEL